MAVHPELNRARILRSGSVIIFFFCPDGARRTGCLFFLPRNPIGFERGTTNPNPIIKPISTRLLQ